MIYSRRNKFGQGNRRGLEGPYIRTSQTLELSRDHRKAERKPGAARQPLAAASALTVRPCWCAEDIELMARPVADAGGSVRNPVWRVIR